jgi:hypothetical protein
MQDIGFWRGSARGSLECGISAQLMTAWGQ